MPETLSPPPIVLLSPPAPPATAPGAADTTAAGDRAPRRGGIPVGAALGLPLLVGLLLSGRRATWTPGAALSSLMDQGTTSGAARLPIWADELHRLLPAQPDPILTPLAAHGMPVASLLMVAGASLIFSAVLLLLLAKFAGMGERARFDNALACALHLKILVLALNWGAGSLTRLAPPGTLALLGGPTVALIGCGLVAALLVVRADFETGLPRAALAVSFAVVLPLLIPMAAPFLLAPVFPAVGY
ncbi:MAG: hypothetical protein ACYTGX_14945 [Planctomycetota bacterium]|jgi:hypothetical protein